MAEPPAKRFRYATYNEKLRDISVDKGRTKGLSWEKDVYDEDTGQTSTPFTSELARLSIHDLTVPYQTLARALSPLSTSLPITLLNLPTIFQTLTEYYRSLKDGEDHLNSGLESALSLHLALYATCLSEGAAYLPITTRDLIRVGSLRALEPKLIEKAFSILSEILRMLASTIVKPDGASQSVLRASWQEVTPYLRPKENKQYVRKCVSDAWIGVLRKARGDGLERLIGVLLEDQSEGMEAVWSGSMKGTQGQLHSRALPLFEILLRRTLEKEDKERVHMLEMVLISLAHYCSAATLAPITSALVVSLQQAASSNTRSPTQISLLRLTSALLFTRKGKRLAEMQIKPTMTILLGMAEQLSAGQAEERASKEWTDAYVEAVVASLMASKLEHWLSPGVTLIDKACKELSTEQFFALVNSLVKLKWAGVEQFLLTHVAKTALPALETSPLASLTLLNNLSSAGYLSGGLSNVQGGRWRKSLLSSVSSLLARLAAAHEDTDSRRQLGQVLHLIPALHDGSPFANSLEQLLADSVERFEKAGAEGANADWREAGAWNEGHVTASVLECIAQLAPIHDELRIPVARSLLEQGGLQSLVTAYGWNREVLEQLATLADQWSADKRLLALDTSPILPNLISADSALRASSLRLLILTSAPTDSDNLLSPHNIWTHCQAVEQSEMTLRNIRDRTAQIARLGRLLQSVPKDASEAVLSATSHGIQYLLSQLKVNYRPIYPEAIKALQGLTSQHGDVIWEQVWAELEKTHAARVLAVPDLQVENPAWTVVEADNDKGKKVKEESEEEAEFRCTAMDKMVKTFKKEWAGAADLTILDASEISAQISLDRLDVLNYEAQLIAFLAAVPLLAEKHTRLIVPMFFAVSGYEHTSPATQPTLSTRALQNRTATFLELFTKFVNPKAAFRSDELRDIYLDILAKGDNRLQKLALECVLTFKSPNLVNYAENLRTLLEESKFRDELTHFSLERDAGVIEGSHRPEAVAVTTRLLYGIITARRGRTSAHGLQGRKQAILTALSGCSSAELQTLVDLMLEPFKGEGKGIAPGRQQLGFMSLLHDVLRYLGPQIADHWPILLGTTIELVSSAQAKISQESITMDIDVAEEDGDADLEDAAEAAEESSSNAPLRSIRTAGIKRIVEFIRSRVDFDFTPYLARIFDGIISPRLDKLDVENTQAPSGVLDLIAAIAVSPRTAPSLSELDARTLPQTFACLVAPKVKPSVIGRVFDVIDSLLALDNTTILSAHDNTLLARVIELVPALKQGGGQDDLLRRLLGILSQLSTIVTDGPQAQTLASLLGPMLRQPNKQFPEKAKLNILLTLRRLYAISPDFADPASTFFGQSYELISNLLQALFFPSSRRALIGVLNEFAAVDAQLAQSIRIVGDLNAYSVKRMDEPDFAKRLDAFGEVNDGQVKFDTRRQWLPLLRSALFFIRDPEELSIRTNASALLHRFLTTVGATAEGELVDVLSYLVIPGLKQALKSKLEMVRNEILAIFSYAVKTCTGVPVLVDLQPLLGQDEEQDFFVNMAHIQVHRRTRAIHRLRDLVAEGAISESATSTIFLPLLEHVITGATEISDHHLVNESITSVGALSSVLRWSRYNALLTRYLKLGSSKSAQQKFYIRTVSAIIDNFHFDLSATATVELQDAAVVDGEDDNEVEIETAQPAVTQSAKITEVVLGKLLPSLTRFVEQKDETEDNIRIPVALGIVKIAHALPTESSAVEVLRIITTTSQILRSKDQDTRDLARETVCKIAVYLGPDWLVRVVKELREALQRGPQKHVLAVTVHAILVQAMADERFSNLDAAVQDAVEVSAEVVWGESGKDVESEGFKSKMREVKGASSRGYDTFQLVSRLASPGKVATILGPVRDVMHASQAVKTMLHVDETLRRITLGLNANAQLGPQDLLSLCYSLIGGNSSYLKVQAKIKHKAAKGSTANVGDRFLVQMKRDPGKEEDFYALNAHKFVAFGLDLFVTAFRRGKFNFDDQDILSRLGPLVGAIGNTLYSSHETVLSLGLKATAAVARCPLPQLEDALPVYVTNIMKVIKSAGGTVESELVQTALKALAVIVRDCKSSTLTDGQLKYIFETIAPDMEESDRQAAIFAILRAIVSRKFVVPEIYDLMDRVSSIMVTSQSTNVQEQCRSVLMAFLLDYPQGSGRLKAQMTFLAQNLSYVYETGRVSVMELLSAVFGKFSDSIVEEYCDLFFVALVMVLANDDSEKCRSMASVLIKLLLESVGEGSQSRIVGILNGWVKDRAQNRVLAGAALNVLGSLIGSEVDVAEPATRAMLPIISESATQLGDAEAQAELSAFPTQLDHIVPHQALSGLGKLLLLNTDRQDEHKLPLDDIIAHLLFPHDWVRFDATRVLSTLFSKDSGAGIVEFEDRQLLDVARKACIVLKGGKDSDGEETVVDPKLADEVVKLLWNIAKYWAAKEAAGQLSANAVATADILAEADGVDDADAAADATATATSTNDISSTFKPKQTRQNPLSWLMSRASFLSRTLIVNRPASHIPYLATQWTRPVMSILRFFAGSIQAMDESLARRYARHVLSPVYRVLDEGGELALVKEGDEGLVELKQLATEVRDFVQSKIGTTDFSHVWENIRKTTRERREGRREARSQLAVQNPQAFAQRKEKRGEMKKESKKRKVKAFADMKYRERPTKKRG